MGGPQPVDFARQGTSDLRKDPENVLRVMTQVAEKAWEEGARQMRDRLCQEIKYADPRPGAIRGDVEETPRSGGDSVASSSSSSTAFSQPRSLREAREAGVPWEPIRLTIMGAVLKEMGYDLLGEGGFIVMRMRSPSPQGHPASTFQWYETTLRVLHISEEGAYTLEEPDPEARYSDDAT